MTTLVANAGADVNIKSVSRHLLGLKDLKQDLFYHMHWLINGVIKMVCHRRMLT